MPEESRHYVRLLIQKLGSEVGVIRPTIVPYSRRNWRKYAGSFSGLNTRPQSSCERSNLALASVCELQPNDERPRIPRKTRRGKFSTACGGYAILRSFCVTPTGRSSLTKYVAGYR